MTQDEWDWHEFTIQQARQKVIHQWQERLKHELSEALICLVGENPNIDMAIGRIKQAQRWMSNAS